MIKRFYKTATNEVNKKIRVLDFDKIRAEGHDFNIILSERFAQGKTLNGFLHILDRFIKYKEASIYLVNTKTMLDVIRVSMINGCKRLYPELWYNVKIKGNVITYKDEIFCYLIPLSAQANYKPGTRIVDVRTIIYDEFNHGLRMIGNKQYLYLMTLIQTFIPLGNGVVFIFGNKATINVPLLTHLGLTEIKEECEIKKFEDLSIMFYVPVKPKEIRQRLEREKNWVHSLAKLGGLYEMTVLNSKDLDSLAGVVPERMHKRYKHETYHDYIYFDNNAYGKVWITKDGGKFIEWIGEKPKLILGLYTLRASKTDSDVRYKPLLKDHLHRLIYEGRLWFSNFIAKSYTLQDLVSRKV